MKSPDEIKKGLECCLGDCHNYHCEECPYADHDTQNYDGCTDNGRQLSDDALALIQQLEAERDKAVNALTISLFRQNEITCCSFCKNKNGCERNPYGTSRCFVWEGMPTT